MHDIIALLRKTSRDPEDDTPKDYLKRELRDRMGGGPVEYLLQLQVYEMNNVLHPKSTDKSSEP